MRRFKVFISSPGDVAIERDAARAVMAQVSARWAEHVDIQCYDYREDTFHSRGGFQEQVPNVADYDLVVGIVWKRLGTPLDPGRFPDAARACGSGTQYEIETAFDAARACGRPEVVVFRKDAPVQYDEADAEWQMAQHKALKAWWADCFGAMGQPVRRASTSFADTDSFAAAFERWLEQWLRSNGGIPEGPSWRVEIDGSPYPGLVCYDARTARVFRGRDASLRRALGVLRRRVPRGEPSLFVVGPSGSGKSSFVRAGLIPRLTTPGGLMGVSEWRVVVIEPGANPLGQLAASLFSRALPEMSNGPQRTPEAWAALASAHPEGAAHTVAWALDSVSTESRLLLVADQLESLASGPGGASLVAALHALVANARVLLVATLQSNRYALLQENPQLAHLRGDDGVLDLPPPGQEALREIIDQTAADAGLVWDRAADGRMLNEVLAQEAGSADALPLVQMALHRLFDERLDGNRLTFDAYAAMGGLAGAIATLADATIAGLPAEAAAELDALLRGVVAESDGRGAPVLRPLPPDWAHGNAARESLLQALVSARLLIDDAGHVRVAHEALLRQWPRARDSAALRPESLRLTLALTPLAAAWQQSGAADDLTLPPALLASATALVEEAPTALDERVSCFVRAVEQRTAAEREAELARSRAREWVAAARYNLTRAPDEALSLAIRAYESAELDETREMLRQTIHAARCRAMLTGAPVVRDAIFAPGSSTLLTAHADGSVQLWDARVREWRQTLVQPTGATVTLARLMADGTGRWLALARANELTLLAWPSGDEVGRVRTHDSILSIAFDAPGGRVVVTHGATVETFSVPGLEHLDRWNKNYAVSACFSADGRHIIGHWDNSSLLAMWSPEERRVVWSVTSPGQRPVSVGDPQGRWRVVAAGDGAILAAVGSDERQRLGPEGPVAAVAWIDDDGEFALGHENGTISIWRVKGPREGDAQWRPIAEAITTLAGHRAAVWSMAWRADGQLLASGDDDGYIRLWKRTPAGMLSRERWGDGGVLGSHGRRAWWLAFATASSSVDCLMSLDADRQLRLWDVGATVEHARGRLPVSTGFLGGPSYAQVGAITTTSDGSAVITLDPEQAPVLYDSDGRTVATLARGERGMMLHALPDSYRCQSASFSADGQYALTLHGDGVAALWRVVDGTLSHTLDTRGRPLVDVRFLPDGTTILGLNDRNRLLWWQVGAASRARLRTLPRGWSVLAIDGAGRRVLGRDREGRNALWSVADEHIIAPLEEAGESTSRPRFSDDDRRVLMDGEAPGTLITWSAATGALEARHSIDVDRGSIYSHWTLDEHLFVAGDAQGTLTLWDRRTDASPRPLRGHVGKDIVLALGPGGALLASADAFKTVVWDVSLARPSVELPGGATSLAITADGRRLITASATGQLRWWCLDGASLLTLAKKRGPRMLHVSQASLSRVENASP